MPVTGYIEGLLEHKSFRLLLVSAMLNKVAMLRTTQTAGTATDLGSALGRIMSRFFRRDLHLYGYTGQDGYELAADRQKLVLITCLLVCFITGGLAGSAADMVFAAPCTPLARWCHHRPRNLACGLRRRAAGALG